MTPWGSGAALRFALFGGVGLLVVALMLTGALQATAPDRAGHVAAVKAYNTASEVRAIFSQDPSAVNAISANGAVTGTSVGKDGLNNAITVGVSTQIVSGAYVVTATAPNGTTYVARTALKAAAAPDGANMVAR